MSTVVLHGATGYTGRLAAAAMLRAGLRPVLSGRSRSRLEDVAAELAPGLPLSLHVSDGADPSVLVGALAPGDVLVSTVGPFAERGQPALDAALEAGAHYVDVSAEPVFLRAAFEQAHPRAEGRCAVLPSFGFDYVPGTLAAALALRQAGPAATAVDVGYFVTGGAGVSAISGGTLETLRQILASPSFSFRDGRLVDDRPLARSRTFEVLGERRRGRSIGAAEQLSLPHTFPRLREVSVYLGWSGRLERPLLLATGALAQAARVPGVAQVASLVPRALQSVAGFGPDVATRSRTGSAVVAEARADDGTVLAVVQLGGANMYDATASLLAWAARLLAAGEVRGTGVLGPVEAMGMDALVVGCAEAGLTRL